MAAQEKAADNPISEEIPRRAHFDDRIQVVDTIETCSLRTAVRSANPSPLARHRTRWTKVCGVSIRTAKTITDTPALLAEFRAIRKRGYVFDPEESFEGAIYVGAAIRYQDRGIVGAPRRAPFER